MFFIGRFPGMQQPGLIQCLGRRGEKRESEKGNCNGTRISAGTVIGAGGVQRFS